MGPREPREHLCNLATMVLASYLYSITEAARGATHMVSSSLSTLLIVTELSWPHTIACAVSPGLRTQGPGGGAREIVRGAARAGARRAARGGAGWLEAARRALQGRSSRAYGP